MTKTKRIVVNVTDSMFDDIEGFINRNNLSRSQFVREALYQYLEEIKRAELVEQMRAGYQEMGEMNLQLAEEAFMLEHEVNPSFLLKVEGGVRSE